MKITFMDVFRAPYHIWLNPFLHRGIVNIIDLYTIFLFRNNNCRGNFIIIQTVSGINWNIDI